MPIVVPQKTRIQDVLACRQCSLKTRGPNVQCRVKEFNSTTASNGVIHFALREVKLSAPKSLRKGRSILTFSMATASLSTFLERLCAESIPILAARLTKGSELSGFRSRSASEFRPDGATSHSENHTQTRTQQRSCSVHVPIMSNAAESHNFMTGSFPCCDICR